MHLLSQPNHNALSGPDVITTISWDGWHVEDRTQDGYDAGVPGSAVLIHTLTARNNVVLKNRAHANGV